MPYYDLQSQIDQWIYKWHQVFAYTCVSWKFSEQDPRHFLNAKIKGATKLYFMTEAATEDVL